MKKRLQGLLAGLLIGLMVPAGFVFAKNGTETVDANYKDIKIYVDGVKIDPKDANGDSVEPFIYNGTTYLPVRAVGEAFGKNVSWDGKTSSVYIGKKPGEEQNLFVVCPPYDGYCNYLNMSSEGKFITMGGKKYSDAMQLGNSGWGSPYTSFFNLDGEYKSLSFDIGRLDGQPKSNATLNIYLDGELHDSYELSAEDLPRNINIDLNHALQLKIELITSWTAYGIANAIIE